MRLWIKAVAFLVLLAPPILAFGHCPEGPPCETVTVYRVQTWPHLMQDKRGISMLSISEANGLSDKALREFLNANPNTGLVIRYTIIRMRSADGNLESEEYCTCNLENNKKGCPASLPLSTLEECQRLCLNDGETCIGTGLVNRCVRGFWYAFPSATQKLLPNQVWKKQSTGERGTKTVKLDGNWADWEELAQDRTIKRSSCIADGLADEKSLEQLFADETPCERINLDTLKRESAAWIEKKRAK